MPGLGAAAGPVATSPAIPRAMPPEPRTVAAHPAFALEEDPASETWDDEATVVANMAPVLAASMAPEPERTRAAVLDIPSPVPAEVSPRGRSATPPVPAEQASLGPDEVRARPAALWRRLCSFAIDGAAIGAVAFAYLMAASAIAGLQSSSSAPDGLDGFVAKMRTLESILVPGFFLLLVLAVVYCAVAAFLWDGRTLGRRMLGLQLVDSHGFAPAPGRAVVRALLSGVSFCLFLGGFWLALFDRRGQTLHDKLTSTFVVQPS